MEIERIKSPDGIRNLMAELWKNHIARKNGPCRVYMVDLPEPTEEEKRIMAANRVQGNTYTLEELKESLQKAADKLGGW